MEDLDSQPIISPLFQEALKILAARQRLGPQNKELKELILNNNFFRQTPYSYEVAVFECWLDLKEKAIINQKQITKEDLEAVRVVLSWVSGLTKEQIEFDKMPRRTSPPLFMDAQTKGEIKSRLDNLTEEKLKESDFFNGLLAFFNGLVKQMETRNLLINPISEISERFFKKSEQQS